MLCPNLFMIKHLFERLYLQGYFIGNFPICIEILPFRAKVPIGYKS